MTKNENKTITVCAIGYKPSADFTAQSDLGVIQCTISETTEEQRRRFYDNNLYTFKWHSI